MSGEPSTTTVTLATIAARLGVSRSTVSNAYNHPDQLSPALRQRVLDTAKSMGYTGPDPVARRLRKGRAGAIGVLFSELLQYAFADVASVMFLEGVATASEHADSGMLLIPAPPTQQSATIIHDAMVDGFILYSIPPTHPFVDVALGRRVPVVCVDQTRIPGVSWIGIDDRKAASDAANHLLELGHRDFAILVYGLGEAPRDESTGRVQFDDVPEDYVPTVSWLRLRGYRDAMQEQGVDWDAIPMIECDMNSDVCGARAAHTLAARDHRPTGLLCTSDSLALGVIDVAEQVGFRVPQDVSVVGFNDIPGASLSSPTLTTIRQPLREKGAQAAALLLGGHAEEPSQIHLDAELIVRQSSAAPNS